MSSSFDVTRVTSTTKKPRAAGGFCDNRKTIFLKIWSRLTFPSVSHRFDLKCEIPKFDPPFDVRGSRLFNLRLINDRPTTNKRVWTNIGQSLLSTVCLNREKVEN